MFEMAKALHHLGFREEVYIVNCPSLPKGGDVIDAIEKGVSIENALSTGVLVPPPATLDWILDQIANKYIKRYIFLSDEQAHGIALWVAHTYIFMEFMFTPYLYVSSAVPSSGKSSLMELMTKMSCDSIYSLHSTPASIVRDAGDSPTLLLDEIDSSMRDHEFTAKVLGVLNAGNRRGGEFRMVEGEGSGRGVKAFPVYCAKALAGNSKPPLPVTVASRSLGIDLKYIDPLAPDEQVADFREVEINAIADPIRDGLEEWSETTTCWELLDEVQSLLPDYMDGRRKDMWEVVFCIAKEAGGNWVEYAQKAVPVLVVGVEDDDDYDRDLLSAIRLIFGMPEYQDKNKYDEDTRIPINTPKDGIVGRLDWGLVDQLLNLDEYDFEGLTDRKLNKKLQRFGIRVKSNRLKQLNKTARSVMESDFKDAWNRLLPKERDIGDKSHEHGVAQENGRKPVRDKGAIQDQMLHTHDRTSIA